jgi:hypothetical protein
VNSFDYAIRPGVVLFLGGDDDCADRVRLSSGTIVAQEERLDGNYQEGAVVPRPDWRSLTAADRRILIAESCPKVYGNTVSVIRIPSPLLDPFRSLRGAGGEQPTTYDSFPKMSDKDRSKAADAIIGYLQQHFQRSNAGKDCGIEGGVFTRPPGQPTVTWDPEARAYIGLHVDSWYDFPLNRREYAPNRICVNLGQEDRFFLFSNIPIGQMYQLAKHSDTSASFDIGLTSGVRAFMTSYPSYPVVRIRIRPGEAYIAPTENIAHDGSSVDMDHIDVTLSIRGCFETRPKALL